jgi:predicted enzyme related to lactoylglutathione lyase
MAHLHLVTLVVGDYDRAITFFRTCSTSTSWKTCPPRPTTGGPSAGWSCARKSGETGVLLARAAAHQEAAVGRQFAGRVGMFLRVDDFDAAASPTGGGQRHVRERRIEPYGRIVVFRDLEGNRWDLLGPAPAVAGDAARNPRRPVGLTLTHVHSASARPARKAIRA